MRFCKITAVLTALIIVFSALGLGAFAAGAPAAVDSARLAEKMKTATFSTASGKLSYRIYRSSGYDISVDTKPAVLIIYLHNESGKGDDNTAQLAEKGLLHQLVSDSADVQYSKYQYIVVAPQCPAGESFVEDGKPTATLDMVDQLRQELRATEILTDKCMIMGVGTGADAAFVYASAYTSAVSRVLTVGGNPEKSKVYGAIAAGATFFCFAEDNNTAVRELDRFVENQGDSAYLDTYYSGSNVAEAVEAALGHGEPSVTEWVIKDAYENRYFKIHASCTEAGGKVSVSPENVIYGGTAKVLLTLNKGFVVERLVINGNDAAISDLVRSENNKNQYTYTFKNVDSERYFVAELVGLPEGSGASGFFDSILTWLTVISAVLVVLAAAVFGISYYKNKKTV